MLALNAIAERRARVLYIATEGALGIAKYRLQKACRAHGKTLEELDPYEQTLKDGEWTPLPFAARITGIDGHGTLVGTYASGSGDHAFVYRDGVLTDLGTLGGANSYANARNRHGVVVGSSLVRLVEGGLERGEAHDLPQLLEQRVRDLSEPLRRRAAERRRA